MRWQAIYGVKMSGKAAFLRVRRCRPKVLESADLSTRGARVGSREAFLYLGQTKQKQYVVFQGWLAEIGSIDCVCFFFPTSVSFTTSSFMQDSAHPSSFKAHTNGAFFLPGLSSEWGLMMGFQTYYDRDVI